MYNVREDRIFTYMGPPWALGWVGEVGRLGGVGEVGGVGRLGGVRVVSWNVLDYRTLPPALPSHSPTKSFHTFHPFVTYPPSWR